MKASVTSSGHLSIQMMTGNDENATNLILGLGSCGGVLRINGLSEAGNKKLPAIAFCPLWPADSDINGSAWQTWPITRKQAWLRERRVKGRFRSPLWRVFPFPLNTL
jgi:hypothetical protein